MFLSVKTNQMESVEFSVGKIIIVMESIAIIVMI